MLNFTTFNSPIGLLVIAWTNRGVSVLQLPHQSADQAVAAFCRNYPSSALNSSPPAFVCRAIESVQLHLGADLHDFKEIPLDLDHCSSFAKRVYSAACQIPAGSTRTYGELAASIGCPGAARAVGRALSANPVGIIIPCHRILGKGSKPTGFSAYGGCELKLKLLSLEGATIHDTKLVVSV